MDTFLKNKTTIQENYLLPEAFEIIVLRSGPDNDMFLVSDKQKHKDVFVVRVSKRKLSQDDIIFETTWLAELKKKNIPVPEIVKTKTGVNFFLDKNGQLYLAFKYIEGSHPEINLKTKPDLKLVAQAAKTLAQIHNVSFNTPLDLPRKRNIFTEIDRALTLKNKFAQKLAGGNLFIEYLSFYKNWVKENEGSDYCLIHNDYRAGNILFADNKVAAVIDFDWSCLGPAAKDVAHSLVEWSFPDGAKKPWLDVFDVFLNSYNQSADHKIKLNGDLYNWICFACLSDVATYFSDLAEKNTFDNITSSYMYQKFLYFSPLQ